MFSTFFSKPMLSPEQELLPSLLSNSTIKFNTPKVSQVPVDPAFDNAPVVLLESISDDLICRITHARCDLVWLNRTEDTNITIARTIDDLKQSIEILKGSLSIRNIGIKRIGLVASYMVLDETPWNKIATAFIPSIKNIYSTSNLKHSNFQLTFGTTLAELSSNIILNVAAAKRKKKVDSVNTGAMLVFDVNTNPTDVYDVKIPQFDGFIDAAKLVIKLEEVRGILSL
jgi:hypothetical protein